MFLDAIENMGWRRKKGKKVEFLLVEFMGSRIYPLRAINRSVVLGEGSKRLKITSYS